MKALFTASLVGAMAIVSAPALAAAGGAINSRPAAVADARAESKESARTLYCGNVIFDTGSRIARRMCKTKEEWSDQGVELAPKE